MPRLRNQMCTGTHCLYHRGWGPLYLCLMQCESSAVPSSSLRTPGWSNLRETWYLWLECLNWIPVPLPSHTWWFSFHERFKNFKSLAKIFGLLLRTLSLFCPWCSAGLDYPPFILVFSCSAGWLEVRQGTRHQKSPRVRRLFISWGQ